MAEIVISYITCSQDPSLSKGKPDCEHNFVDTPRYSSQLTRSALIIRTVQRCRNCHQERIKVETEEKY